MTNALALDISTSCTGISLMNEEGVLLKMDHIKLDKFKGKDDNETFFLRGQAFHDFIKAYKTENITTVCIEDPLAGSNNQFTANKLIRFNGMCSYILYQELGIQPTYLTVHEIRKSLCPEFVTTTKGKETFFIPKDIDKKKYIWDIINRTYPGREWLYDKKGGLKKENFDMSDSVAINLAAWMKRARENQTNANLF